MHHVQMKRKNEQKQKERRILSKMQTHCTIMEIRLNVASCQLAIIICHYIIPKTITYKVSILKSKIVSSYIIMFSNFCNITGTEHAPYKLQQNQISDTYDKRNLLR